MANTITKYQVQYLKDRLNDIKREKIKQFKTDNSLDSSTEMDRYIAVYDAIKAGKIKLKPRKDIAKEHYYGSMYVRELFDIEAFDAAFDKAEKERADRVNKYTESLENAITEILDSVVLRGLDVQEAVAKFESM